MGGRRLRRVRAARRRGRRAPRRARRRRARRRRPRRRVRHRQRRHPRRAGGRARHRRRPHARSTSRRRGRAPPQPASRSTGSRATSRRCRSRTTRSTSCSPRSAACSRRATRWRRPSCARVLRPAGPARDLRVHARRRGRRLLPDARSARTAAAGLRGEPARLGRPGARALAVRRPRPALRAAVLLRALRVPRRTRSSSTRRRSGRSWRSAAPALAGDLRALFERHAIDGGDGRSPTTTSSRCRWRRERVSPTAPGAAPPA